MCQLAPGYKSLSNHCAMLMKTQVHRLSLDLRRGTLGFAILANFSCGISVILILNCGIGHVLNEQGTGYEYLKSIELNPYLNVLTNNSQISKPTNVWMLFQMTGPIFNSIDFKYSYPVPRLFRTWPIVVFAKPAGCIFFWSTIFGIKTYPSLFSNLF